MASRLVRPPQARVFERYDRITVIGADGRGRCFDADSTPLVRAVLELLGRPRSRDQLLDELAARAGEPDPAQLAPLVDELLAVLGQAGAIGPAGEGGAIGPASAASPRSPPRPPRLVAADGRRPRLLLGLSGAVASLHAGPLVQTLLDRGFQVRVAMTPTATRFASKDGLEALTHEPVLSDLWPRDLAMPVPHVNLAEWAEIVAVYPASATTLSRLCRGDFGELVAAAALATRAPVVLFPSMNAAMYAAPSVQRNLRQLAEDGFYVVQPSVGHEVAHRPEARQAMFGPALGFHLAAELIEFVYRQEVLASAVPTGSAGTSAVSAPAPALAPLTPVLAAEWDALYAGRAGIPAAALPWLTEGLEPDLARALEALDAVGTANRRRLWDVGTGTGSVAIAAARRGFDVVASELSPVALGLAWAREGARQVSWVLDDVCESRLTGPFDVVVDRGCFHGLPEEQRGAYRETLVRLTRPGARLLLKVHAHDEPVWRGPHRFRAEEIAGFFAPHFRLLGAEPGHFAGPTAAPPRSLLCVLERV